MQSEPLVSAIMPTRGRPEFAITAVEQWAMQTYRNRELVIVDDADAPSFPREVPLGEGISYHRLPTRLTVGAKRNVACSRSRGEIICHWDDDDWSAPERIADQVTRLLETGAQVTGYRDMLFHDQQTGREWRYLGHNQQYCVGSSLLYLRTFWQAHVFENRNVAEDTNFWMAAMKSKAVAACEANGMMRGTIHPGNTSPRQIKSKQYQEVLACV